MSIFIAVCVLFVLKHILCDYGFQTTWMVHGKRRGGLRFILPLLCHSLIHGAVTFYVCLVFIHGVFFTYNFGHLFSNALFAAGIDTVSHFIIDRSKALFERLSENRTFRVALMSVDQVGHGIVYLIIICYLLA